LLANNPFARPQGGPGVQPRRRPATPVAIPNELPLPQGERMSTQEGFGKILFEIAGQDDDLARRIVTTSPDVTVSTNLGGWVNRNVYGMPGLLLVTTGAKSGLSRTSPLLYLRDGDDFLIVGTNFGQGHHPAWTANLLAEPHAEIEVGPATLPVVASPIEEPELARCWERFVALYPGYAGYLERSGRKPHMFRLRPATR